MRYIYSSTVDKMPRASSVVAAAGGSTSARAMEWHPKSSTTEPAFLTFLDSWVWVICDIRQLAAAQTRKPSHFMSTAPTESA